MSADDTDDTETVEELERQARAHEEEERIAGALKDANDLFEDEPVEDDAYQQREHRRQAAFNQMYDDVDPDETGTYLENHHELEKINSDGNGDT